MTNQPAQSLQDDPTHASGSAVDVGWTLIPEELIDPEQSILDTMIRSRSYITDDSKTTGDLRHLSLHTAVAVKARTPDERSVSSQSQDAYTLFTLVATGGCGEVWMARQNSLERVVALKAIRGSINGQNTGQTVDSAFLERAFRIEAMVTAQLEHPNIVPVYDFGTDENGKPVMAMKLVRGQPWNDVLSRDFDQMNPDDYLSKHLPILMAVMQAVAFAHSRGIIHRDLKPGQVMIGEFGEVMLMDWGLAISTGVEESATGTLGDEQALEKRFKVRGMPSPATAANPCGTPVFMAPEQTRPSALDISLATDIYLLGGILYQILAGRPPRRGTNVRETVRLASKGVVVPLEEAASGRPVPNELARIALKALAPDPENRYSRVSFFMDDIRLYLSGASSRSEAEALVSQVKERFTAIQRKSREPIISQVHRLYSDCAECLADLARAATLYPRLHSVVRLRRQVLDLYSNTALNQGDLMLARGLAALMEPGIERHTLLENVGRKERDLQAQKKQRKWMIIGLFLLIAGHGLGITLYLSLQIQTSTRLTAERDAANAAKRAAADLQERAESDTYFSSIQAADVSFEKLRGDSAAQLLLEGTQPHLRQWEWGVLAKRVLGDRFSVAPFDFVASAAWAPDMSRIYSGSRDGSAHYWNGKTGRYEGVWRYFQGRLYEIKPSPDGSRLLMTGFDGYGVIARASDGAILHRLHGHTSLLRGGAWTNDGKLAATTGFDKSIIIWNPETGSAKRRITGFDQAVNGCQFNQDGSALLVYADDGRAQTMETSTGKVLVQFSGPGTAVNDADFSEDFTKVITACADHFVRLYDAASGKLLAEHQFTDSGAYSICFIPGTPYYAVILDNGEGSIVETNTGRIITRFLSEGLPRELQVSPNRRFLTVAGRFNVQSYLIDELIKPTTKLDAGDWLNQMDKADAYISAYGVTPGRDPLWKQMEKPWNVPKGLTALSKGGRVILVQSRYSELSPTGTWRFDIDPERLSGQAVETSTGRVLFRPSSSRLSQAKVSPDGRFLAIVNPVDKVHIVDTTTWQEVLTIQGESPASPPLSGLARYLVGDIAFAQDSRRLAIAYLNGRMCVWDLPNKTRLYETTPLAGVGPAVTFSPDGKTIVTGGNDDKVVIWNAETGTMSGSIRGHNRPIMAATFSNDGRRLVTIARDRTVRLWDPFARRELMTLLKTPDGKLPVGAQFTRDDQSLAVIVNDGTLELYDSMPYDEKAYPSDDAHSTLTLAHRIELYNRRKLLGNHVTIEDLLHVPSIPTAVYTTGTATVRQNATTATIAQIPK